MTSVILLCRYVKENVCKCTYKRGRESTKGSFEFFLSPNHILISIGTQNDIGHMVSYFISFPHKNQNAVAIFSHVFPKQFSFQSVCPYAINELEELKLFNLFQNNVVVTDNKTLIYIH